MTNAPTAPKRVLVLGGTVYLSRTLARLAVERGHRVTVAARGTSGEPPEGAEFARIDRASPEGLEALRGRDFDAVVDVARVPAQVGPVLDLLADRVGHWSFVSTISVYARNDVVAPDLLEPTAPDSSEPAVEFYGASKVACENLVREKAGAKALVTRPGLIVGAGDPLDRLGYWPLRLAEGGEVLAPGDPARPVQWIDVADYAAWLLDAAESGLTGTFDAIAEPVGMGAFLDGIAEALQGIGVLDGPPRLTWTPQEFLTEHGVNPWAGPDSLGMWLPTPDYDGHCRPAARAVAAGLRPSPLGETIERWWRANAEAPQLKAGLSREKEGAVLGAWHDRTRAFAVPED
ncbi:NAD-dependent epimerase/dehydratase family protein [Glycomyces paridis]|uniref:NAD-dependent epimerase/dehydratase family protein n=1 Tax=Glycomyces paridis TaxID=2126555 RepID=A0A4S8PMU3_9ACTN|nr:NAD-dependent epimerase/dehydratase family protein [Glycomyces paridis]THV31451.1 NAD-dependent epimerase/dehydratase family protein [Glycomyces paridis]